MERQRTFWVNSLQALDEPLQAERREIPRRLALAFPCA